MEKILYFFHGTMNSSKTAHMLMKNYALRSNKSNVALFKSAIDNRSGELKIASRTGMSATADGIIKEKQGVYKDLLFKDSSKNRSYVVKRMRKGVKEASLEYVVLSEKENKSLVKVILHTGRTHQIRVQFSSRKTPLCGDIKYGSKDRESDIALFSHSISFCHPVTEEMLTFTEYPTKIDYPWNLFGSDLGE
jgi:23S rRNA-/tRNA-specific pseudouridylate synthase